MYPLNMTEKERKEQAEQCYNAYEKLDRTCRGCILDGYCPKITNQEETER